MSRHDGGFETLCAHFAEDCLAQGGGASPPIVQSSTFMYPHAQAFEQRDREKYFEYSRVHNPTTRILEAKFARLEHAQWGRAFSSGMGAVTAVIGACVHHGAHVLCVDHVYGPTRTFLSNYLNRFGVEVTYLKNCEPDPFIHAIKPNTRLIYLESPTSGHMDIIDYAPIAAEARKRGILTAFDNSWATPWFQNPLDFGIDIVLHSATKYIGGHSDVVAGLIAGNDEILRKRLLADAELLGACIDPFAAWLLIRGLRTLPLRMNQHQKSGLAVAQLLAGHPKVARVNHPALESHPRHHVAKRYLRGFAGLLSLHLKDPGRDAAQRFINRLKLFSIGVSWGGFESLVVGGPIFGGEKGLSDWIIRLHVGLETTEDLLADISQALE